MRFGFSTLLIALVTFACESSAVNDSNECGAGETAPCVGTNACTGTRACTSNRTFGSCVCNGGTGGSDAGSGGTGGSAGSVGVQDCAGQGPPSGQWCKISSASAPTGRMNALGISAWTGSKLVVWGGGEVSGTLHGDGGVYDLANDAWHPMKAPSPLKARAGHVVTWAAGKVVIWGGGTQGTQYYADGALYDPATDEWSAMTDPPTGFTGRDYASSGAFGSTVFIWGGFYFGLPAQSGATFDAAAGSWGPMPNASSPSGRAAPGVAGSTASVPWFLVYGGRGNYDSNTVFGDGAIFSAGAWKPLPTSGAPSPRDELALVVAGDEVLIWGGSANFEATTFHADGAIYSVSGNNWSPIDADPIAPARGAHAAVWTGSKLLIWGGHDASQARNDGASYDPATHAWTALPPSPLSPRFGPVRVWTGDELVIWGGCDDNQCFADGARYRP